MPLEGAILHLLGVMVIVREGLLLLFRDELDCEMPDPLEDWDVIELSEAETRAYATVGVSLDDRRHIIPTGLDRVARLTNRRSREMQRLWERSDRSSPSVYPLVRFSTDRFHA